MSSDPIQDAIDHYRSGDSETARRLLKQFIQQNPQDEAAWYWYVEMLPTLTARIRAMETFLQISPDNQKARQALDSLIQKRSALQAASAPPEPREAAQEERVSATDPEPVAPQKPSPSSRRRIIPVLVWVIPVLLLTAAAVFFLNPFSPTPPSEEEIYASGIEPVLGDIEAWNDGAILEWAVQLQTKDSWGLSTYQEDIQDPTLRVIRRDELIANLVPLADEIANQGGDILSAMDSLIPPEDVADQHAIIELCVDYQIRKAEATIHFIQHDTVSRLGENYCINFTSAFTALQEYTEEHSPH